MAREAVDEEGRLLAQRDRARQAGTQTSQNLKGRRAGRATTETQHAAEASKATEAEVLSGRQPAIIAGDPSSAAVPKELVTVGDEKVRMAYVKADSQVVDMSKPFTVDGELLRYPGDTSLGASASNVINCRCSSVYDAQSVFAIRRKAGMAGVVDRTASDQLLTSIGL